MLYLRLTLTRLALKLFRGEPATWIDHPVSGLPPPTLRPLQTWFPFGSAPSVLNLAGNGSSPDRSTKSTRSLSLPLLVGTRFQVLFHSPPGVLFTFPSQYYALSVTG